MILLIFISALVFRIRRQRQLLRAKSTSAPGEKLAQQIRAAQFVLISKERTVADRTYRPFVPRRTGVSMPPPAYTPCTNDRKRNTNLDLEKADSTSGTGDVKGASSVKSLPAYVEEERLEVLVEKS